MQKHARADQSQDTLTRLCTRLKEQHPDCEIAWSDGFLMVRLTLGEVRIRENHAEFFIAGQPFEELDGDGDTLYEAVETFLSLLLDEEKQWCNSVYSTTDKRVQKKSALLFYITGMLELLAMLALARSSLWPRLLILILAPVAALFLLCLIRHREFRRNWVCPRCGTPLPLEPKQIFPQMHYVSRCPHCGTSLIDSAQADRLRAELLSPDMPDDGHGLPRPGGKCASILSAVLLLLFSGVFFLILLAYMAERLPAAAVLNTGILLFVAVHAILLLTRRAPKEDTPLSPQVVLREQTWLPWIGFFGWMLPGLGCLVLSLISSLLETPPHFLRAAFTALGGLGLVFAGTWAVLAGKNRALCIFSPFFILYVTSWGRSRRFTIMDIGSVQLTAANSIKFLDSRGKSLFSVEHNMRGIERLICWLEEQKIPITSTKAMERRTDNAIASTGVVSWHESDRTCFHSHMTAVRITLGVSIALFVAGCILPLLLFLYCDLGVHTTIYLTAFSSLPMILCCLIFAPVLIFGDRPKGATKEWKAMHIHFPTFWLIPPTLLCSAQFVYFWEKAYFQAVDSTRFLFLILLLSVLFILPLCLRASKHPARGSGLFILSLSLLVSSYAIAYGGVLACSRNTQHYPAVVVERHVPAEDDPDDLDHTLTVRLDDGTLYTFAVTESMFEQEADGRELVVCQRDSLLGIRLARLHFPKKDD